MEQLRNFILFCTLFVWTHLLIRCLVGTVIKYIRINIDLWTTFINMGLIIIIYQFLAHLLKWRLPTFDWMLLNFHSLTHLKMRVFISCLVISLDLKWSVTIGIIERTEVTLTFEVLIIKFSIVEISIIFFFIFSWTLNKIRIFCHGLSNISL